MNTAKLITIEDYREIYNTIGRGGLGYEFNYNPRYTAYIVPKEDEVICQVGSAVEAATLGAFTVEPFTIETRAAVCGTMAGTYKTGGTEIWMRVIKAK